MNNIKILVILLSISAICYADAPWDANVRVSTDQPWDTLNQGESCFAVFGDTICAICNTAERGEVANAPYAYSFDAGQSFSSVPFIDSMTGIIWHTDPVLCMDDSGHVHMLIQFDLDQLNHYLSRNGGQTWAETTVVTATYGVDKPWMIVNDNEIFVAWEQVSGQTGLMFARSTDYGQTFSNTLIWDKTGINALCMDENDNLHMALIRWYQDLWYRRSTDKGITWSAEHYLNFNNYEVSYGDRFPINSIAAMGNVVFVTWVDTRNGSWDIWAMRSSDGGTTWGSAYIVDDHATGGQCKCWTIFDVYGGLHLSYLHSPDWPTNAASPFSFWYRYSPDSGQTFYPSIRISDTASASMADFMGEYHIIQSDSEFVYAIWTDGRNGDDNDLYFSKALISELSVQEREPASIPSNAILHSPTVWRSKGTIQLFPCEHTVYLSIYDCTGKCVRDVFQGSCPTPRSFEINALDLPCGVLFIQARTADSRQTCKIVNLH